METQTVESALSVIASGLVALENAPPGKPVDAHSRELYRAMRWVDANVLSCAQLERAQKNVALHRIMALDREEKEKERRGRTRRGKNQAAARREAPCSDLNSDEETEVGSLVITRESQDSYTL